MLYILNKAKDQDTKWLRLDNAAKIYPASANPKRPLVFRLMTEIDRPVNLGILKKALEETIARYPYFGVQIHKGFFWYWMDFESPGVSIYPDLGTPCRYFRYRQREQPQVRLLVKNNTISAEFFHALTDGSGALTFMRHLIFAYARILGINLPEGSDNPLDSVPDSEENEDAYNRYFDPKLPPPPKLSKAFHLPFLKLNSFSYKLLSCEIPTGRLLEAARENGLTITEYLSAIYLWALQDIYLKLYPSNNNRQKRPVIRVQVPVNLRNLFPSKTLRNFTLFVVPEIDTRLGYYSFEEICRLVHYHMLLETDPKLLRRIIYRNVRNEKSIFIRIIPLTLKNIVLRYYFHRSGLSLYSGLITNLGRVQWPGELSEFVTGMRFYPPPPDQTKVSLGVVTSNNRLILTFGNTSYSKWIEKAVIGFMVEKNIPVKILNV